MGEDNILQFSICWSTLISSAYFTNKGVGGFGINELLKNTTEQHQLTMPTMKLPPITKKQETILQLLYVYRYLDRIQLQAMLNHKDKRRVAAWLKDLRDKDYIEWIYSTDFAEKTKPAIYYIGLNGVRHLKTVQYEDGTPAYPLEDVRKRYKDNERSRTYIDRCLLIASCCLTLKIANRQANSKVQYRFIPETAYSIPEHDYNFLAEHEVLRPSLCIVKQEKKRGEEEPLVTNYLLEIFDSSLPRYRLSYRLKKYVTYLNDQEWEGDEPEPIILLVCPTITDLIYAKRKTKKLIEDTYEDDLHIRFTTTALLQEHGVTAQLWEEGRQRFGL